MDDNIPLDTKPDPDQITAGNFLERFASYSFHFLYGREEKKGHIILTPTFWYLDHRMEDISNASQPRRGMDDAL